MSVSSFLVMRFKSCHHTFKGYLSIITLLLDFKHVLYHSYVPTFIGECKYYDLTSEQVKLVQLTGRYLTDELDMVWIPANALHTPDESVLCSTFYSK